jgi:hypothetical protein
MRSRWAATRIPTSERLRAGALPISLALALIVASAAAAHAQVGGRNFVEPLMTEDPNPSNEMELQPEWLSGSQSSDASFEFSLEKTLSPNLSVEVAGFINSPSHLRLRSSSTGFGNINLIGKWAFYASQEHVMRFAIGPDIFLPTGSLSAGAESHPRGGPLLMAEKGMDDLPRRGAFGYLRGLSFLADAGYLPSWSGGQSDVMFGDLCTAYSLSYAVASAKRSGVRAALENLVPFLEFDYVQTIKGRGSTGPDLRLTPALAYQRDAYHLTVGGQFAISAAARGQDRDGIIVLIDITLDQVFPWFGWTPLGWP